jgi:hypothetical protein
VLGNYKVKRELNRFRFCARVEKLLRPPEFCRIELKVLVGFTFCISHF